MNLNSAKLFVEVVNKGSFTAAAEHTGVPVATISRRVSELEASLHVRLLERTTRQLNLTGAGTTLYDHVARGVNEINAGLLALQERESQLTGTLRLSLPPNFEPWWQLLNDFQQLYPNIHIDMYVTERKVDLVEDGIDVALRVGALKHPSAVAKKLLSYRHILCASPQFIEQYGQPSKPDDLIKLPCIAWGKKGQSINWKLGDHEVTIAPILRVNDYPHTRFLATQGMGITEQPPFLVSGLIQQKQLVHVLPDFAMPEQNVTLVYPSRQQLSRIARTYIDFCDKNAAGCVFEKLEGG